MSDTPSLDELWDSVPTGQGIFDPLALTNCPPSARRYLEHAIEPGTRLATAVRLSMSGEIKLNKWLPFEAEEVLIRDRGFVWCATVKMGVVRLRGFDRFVDGEGLMRWKLFGIIPVMRSSGPDVSRSAAGRFAAESVWLPSALIPHVVERPEGRPGDLGVALPVAGQRVDVTLSAGPSGDLRSLSLERWGEPGTGQGYGLRSFGGWVEDERSYDGYTIPTRLRAGWHFNSDRFESEGEFFRCRIEAAAFK